MTEARERRVTARDGTRIFVKDWPAKPGRERPPILCLAGLTRNSADFNDNSGGAKIGVVTDTSGSG
jgi:hypothetical protein